MASAWSARRPANRRPVNKCGIGGIKFTRRFVFLVKVAGCLRLKRSTMMNSKQMIAGATVAMVMALAAPAHAGLLGGGAGGGLGGNLGGGLGGIGGAGGFGGQGGVN